MTDQSLQLLTKELENFVNKAQASGDYLLTVHASIDELKVILINSLDLNRASLSLQENP